MLALTQLLQTKFDRQILLHIIIGTIPVLPILLFIFCESPSDLFHYLRKFFGAFNTMEKCKREFKLRSYCFKFFPNDHKTLDMFIELVRQNEKRFVHENKLYKYYTKRLHRYIPESLCEEYLKSNMPYQTYIPKNKIIKILRKNPEFIKFIDHEVQTPEMVDIVWQKNENLTEYINSDLINTECLKKYPTIIKYVPKHNQTKEMIMFIIDNHKELLEYLRSDLVNDYAIELFQKNKNLYDLDGLNISGKTLKMVMEYGKFIFANLTNTNVLDFVNISNDSIIRFDMNKIEKIILVTNDKN